MKLHRDSDPFQKTGIINTVVMQCIELSYLDICGRQVIKALGFHG